MGAWRTRKTLRNTARDSTKCRSQFTTCARATWWSWTLLPFCCLVVCVRVYVCVCVRVCVEASVSTGLLVYILVMFAPFLIQHTGLADHCAVVACDYEWVTVDLHRIFDHPPKWCAYRTIGLDMADATQLGACSVHTTQSRTSLHCHLKPHTFIWSFSTCWIILAFP